MDYIIDLLNCKVTILQVILFLVAVVVIEIIVKILIKFFKKSTKKENMHLSNQMQNSLSHIHSNNEKQQHRYPVITLCGSTKFKEEFIHVQKELSLRGNIVISVGLFGHSGDNEVWSDGTKEMLDDMHKHKIEMADEVFVIDVGGYIGDSTRAEIEYAQTRGIPVHYLSGKE
jgi:hypothetical protein